MSDVPREFVYTRYPARQGMAWLRTGYEMFSQRRAAWVLLVVGYVLILFALHAIPYLGAYAAAILKPVFAVGLLAAAWDQERGGGPRPQHLFQGFRANVWALVLIGAFFVAGITLAVFASSLVDGGQLLQLMAGSAKTEAELVAALSDPSVEIGMLFSVLLSLLIIVATWWAPALVVFQDASAPAAIVTSVRAAFANWKALAVYGLAVFFYGGVIPTVVIKIVSLVVPEPVMQLLIVALLLPYSLLFGATLQVADYVSYREVFHANETLAPLARGT